MAAIAEPLRAASSWTIGVRQPEEIAAIGRHDDGAPVGAIIGNGSATDRPVCGGQIRIFLQHKTGGRRRPRKDEVAARRSDAQRQRQRKTEHRAVTRIVGTACFFIMRQHLNLQHRFHPSLTVTAHRQSLVWCNGLRTTKH